MTVKPIIFISAVSKELRSTRDLVAKTLLAIGVEPKWQDIAATDAGDLRAVLRKWIDGSQAVIQIVGHCYGFAPSMPDPDFGECSYTQYEAYYARQQGKPVFYIFLDDHHPTDGCGCEPLELHDLQIAYREKVKGFGDLRYTSDSLVQTELLVRKLDDKIEKFRVKHRRWAALVLCLLFVLILSAVWTALRQTQTADAIIETQRVVGQTDAKINGIVDRYHQMEQALVKLADAEVHAKQLGEPLSPDQLRQHAYTILENELGIAKGTLSKELPGFALELYHRDDTTLPMRAYAAYALNKYDEAEKLFVESDAQSKKRMENAQAVVDNLRKDRIEALLGAGNAAREQFHYPKALEYIRAAASLSDDKSDPVIWALVHDNLAFVLLESDKPKEAEVLFRRVVEVRERVLGPEHSDTLWSRSDLSSALKRQTKYAEAEHEDQAIVKMRIRLLGAEHIDTLASRMNLAATLGNRGKYVEEERELRAVIPLMERELGAEQRAVLKARGNLSLALDNLGRYPEAEKERRSLIEIEERVFGPNNPITLESRSKLGRVLYSQRKYSEAEKESREAMVIQERVLGAEHSETLASRTNMANALDELGKHTEAEKEHRAVLDIRRRIFGNEHRHTLTSWNNLTKSLSAQHKNAEAEHEYRSLLQASERVLGADHPDTLLVCYNLGACLNNQDKLTEALMFIQRAADGFAKGLGPQHPLAIRTKDAQELIELRIEMQAK